MKNTIDITDLFNLANIIDASEHFYFPDMTFAEFVLANNIFDEIHNKNVMIDKDALESDVINIDALRDEIATLDGVLIEAAAKVDLAQLKYNEIRKYQQSLIERIRSIE